MVPSFVTISTYDDLHTILGYVDLNKLPLIQSLCIELDQSSIPSLPLMHPKPNRVDHCRDGFSRARAVRKIPTF